MSRKTIIEQLTKRKKFIEQEHLRLNGEWDDEIVKNALFKPGDQVTIEGFGSSKHGVVMSFYFSQDYVYDVAYRSELSDFKLSDTIPFPEEKLTAGWN